jgi:hypothetical protein
MTENVFLLNSIIEITDTIHFFSSFLDEGVIETENASLARVEAFSEPDGVYLSWIPSMFGNESVQGALMTTIQKVPSYVLNVFFTFLTEKQAGEIGVEMSPLRF